MILICRQGGSITLLALLKVLKKEIIRTKNDNFFKETLNRNELETYDFYQYGSVPEF